ncbi:MAG: hypothetical protein HZA94_01865 [Candidatus Vogelbacteria bacterium]|nr:hypothetical protein [Candidatus Vogelbacteria bacterium]
MSTLNKIFFTSASFFVLLVLIFSLSGQDVVAASADDGGYRSMDIEGLNVELSNVVKKDDEERLKSKGLVGKALFTIKKAAGVPEALSQSAALQVDDMLSERAKKLEELMKIDPDKFLEVAERSQDALRSVSSYPPLC